MKNGIKSLAVWLIFLIIFIVLISSIMDNSSNKLAYSELLADMEKGTVKSIEIQSGGEKALVEVEGESLPKEVNIPDINSFMTYAQEILKTNSYTLTEKPESVFMKGLYLLIPFGIIVIVLLFGLLLINPGNQGGNKTMSFGKSKARVTNGAEKTKVTFNDVAGVDEEKEELEEIVEFLKTPKKFTDMGARIPKGVLLVGQPGTGKTLLAKAVAGEAGVPFFSISGSEFVEMFVGVGAGRVRDMFKKAKQTAPCIIFIDEIDAVGRQRGTGMGGGHDEREQTLNQLLVEMDGFSGNEGIIVLAATNRADVLDPALLRPGRFDRQIQVANPDKRARSQILKVHARNKRFTPDVNFDNIAQRTPGFSGAELSNVLNEAALLAVRQGHDLITMADIDEAVDRVMGGPAKKSRKYTEKERRLVAYHEAGHALIGLTLEDANKVQKVTIVPRGQAGGYNLMTPKEETYFQTKSQLKATISGYMGGRVAEEVFFGDVSSGAHNDIEQATRIARMMVTELGMSELGPIQYDSENGQVFLGRDYTQRSNTHSGQIAYEIDVQVRKIIDECYQEATNIVEQHKEKLICIAEALLEHETLSGEDIESLYNTGKMLEHHDGSLNQEPVQEVVEPTVEKPSIDDQDDLLDEMK